MTRRPLIPLLLLALSAPACAPSAAPAANAAAARAPFVATAAPQRSSATVVEVLPAGPYRYLRLDDGRWLATLSVAPIAPGDAVDVTVFATRSQFSSTRLGRVFEELAFGTAARTSPARLGEDR